jgi:hypothetical protein
MFAVAHELAEPHAHDMPRSLAYEIVAAEATKPRCPSQEVKRVYALAGFPKASRGVRGIPASSRKKRKRLAEKTRT